MKSLRLNCTNDVSKFTRSYQFLLAKEIGSDGAGETCNEYDRAKGGGGSERNVVLEFIQSFSCVLLALRTRTTNA